MVWGYLVCLFLLTWFYILTFCAVLALPSGVADDLSALPAGEMAKSVVSGSAENRAAFPVIVLITDEPVRKLELGSARAVQVLSPVLSDRQVSLRRHGADDALRVFYLFVFLDENINILDCLFK